MNKLKGCYLLATMRACLLSQALDAVLKLSIQPLRHTCSTGIALEVVEQVCHQPHPGDLFWSLSNCFGRPMVLTHGFDP